METKAKTAQPEFHHPIAAGFSISIVVSVAYFIGFVGVVRGQFSFPVLVLLVTSFVPAFIITNVAAAIYFRAKHHGSQGLGRYVVGTVIALVCDVSVAAVLFVLIIVIAGLGSGGQ